MNVMQKKAAQLKVIGQYSLVSILGFSVLAGCSIKEPAKPDTPYYAPVQMPTFESPKPVNGAIYHASTSRNIYSDGRANRVGDIITINLTESTQSTKQSTTNTRRQTNIDLPVPTILGKPLVLNKPEPVNRLFNGREFSSSIEGSNRFNGNAASNMSNQLSGNITATIHELYPNGVMLVRGEKWLTLNQGDEYIRVSGLVRPQDIGADNTVDSTRLADARITYSGTGPLAEANAQGWLQRFFSGPFMPF